MEKQLGSKVIRLRVVKVYGIVCRVQFSGHRLEKTHDIRFRKNNQIWFNYFHEDGVRIHVEPRHVRDTDNVYVVSDAVPLSYRHGVRFLVAACLLRLKSDLVPLTFARQQYPSWFQRLLHHRFRRQAQIHILAFDHQRLILFAR